MTKKIFFTKRRVSALVGLSAIWLAILVAIPLRAADPAFVGILALAVQADTAKQLGLSDEVRQKLIALIEQRENEAVSLALSIKDLPPEQRKARLAPFVAKSEQLGLALLTMEQRSKLNQLRIRRAGMSTLADGAVAKVLHLSDQQQEQVRQLLAQRAKAMRQGGERDRQIAHNTYERKLRQVLTDAQLATWDQMAGLGPGTSTLAASEAKPKTAADAASPAVTPTATAPTREPAAPEKPAVTEKTAAANSPSAVVKAEATPSPSAGQEKPAEANPTTSHPAATTASNTARTDATAPPDEVKLRFHFKFQPWKDVLQWLAEQADLSIQSDIIPEGTFNYSDPREFTPDQAIDLINGVLLTKGYTLVRRGRLLNVLNLTDEVPDILVEYVPVDKLNERGEFEIVKTVFHLAKMDPADAETEISKLLGPGRSMVVMPKARQVMVIATAGKLRQIRDVLQQAENPEQTAEQQVTELKLQHVTPDEVLQIARPLLGLAEDENVGDDISISIDTLGTRLFATGSPDKVAILQDIVKRVDANAAETKPGSSPATEQLQLMTHPIVSADPNEVLAVLQTLLAGSPDVRLSLDATTNKIIALARPSEHKTIEATIKQMEGDTPQFEVIQLHRVDPQLALLTINNFFEGGSEGSSDVKVDADPTTMKLYVRAKPAEIEQVKKLITQLESPAENSAVGGNLRFIPLSGAAARTAVETAQRLWTGKNEIRMIGPLGGSEPSMLELREISPDKNKPAMVPPRRQPPAPLAPPGVKKLPPAAHRPAKRAAKAVVPARVTSTSANEDFTVQLVGAPATAPTAPAAAQSAPASNGKGSDIRIEVTPNGIIIASEDTAALDRFEELLRTVAGPQNTISNKTFTVYFLKYAKADVARQLIQDIMGGSGSSGGSSLIGDVASKMVGGGGLMGALLGGGGSSSSSVTTVQGMSTINIVADGRLNCLIVQAVPADRQMVEELLKVVDRESSITDIYTEGKPFIIPINYVAADDVLNVVKEAFADRIATDKSQGGRGGAPNPIELIRALRGGRGRGGSSQATSEPPKMKVTVDQRSNSLIVIAPEPLYQEVRSLVEQLDQASEDLAEEVQVVTLKKANPEAVQKAIAAIMQGTSSSTSRRSSSSSRSSRYSGMPFRPPFSSGFPSMMRGGFSPGMMMMRRPSGSSRSSSSRGRSSFGQRPSSSGRPSVGGSSRTLRSPSSSRSSRGRSSRSRGR